jgi:ribonuclease VapC
MISVASSALLAVLFGEPERDQFREVMGSSATVTMSAGTLIEARIVVRNRGGDQMVVVFDSMIEQFGVSIEPVTEDQAEIAHTAFKLYGKGSGHPAQLNFGDLFSYALAKERGLPLLFKGNDFSATDIVSALSD